MTDSPSQDQIDAARGYDSLLVPALFEQWPPHVLAAAKPPAGAVVLDVATGTGVLADYAQRHVGQDGRVEAIDANAGMLCVAVRRNPGVTWRSAVAENLPYPDASFTTVVSQFGLMFFSDPSRAVREMFRVLTPGGRLAIAVWGPLQAAPGYAAEVSVLDRMLGRRAGDAVRAPFAMGNEDELESLLRGAGVQSVEVATVKGRARFPSVRRMVEADLRGWLPVMGVRLSETEIDDTLVAAESALAEFVIESGEVVFDVSAHVASGSRPSGGPSSHLS